MAEVNVEINGRRFRMACEDGQEERLMSLAGRFNAYIDEFRGSFGEIGDNRLTVMAGIAVLDALSEAERKLALAQKELGEVTEAGHEVAREAEALEEGFAQKLVDVAKRLDTIASALDAAGHPDKAK